MKGTWWLTAAAGVAALVACSNPPPAMMSGRPECPHTWTDSGNHGIVPTGKNWETVDVPEFNDCQRFIVDAGSQRSYTPGYFAIFAYGDTNPLSTRIMTVSGSSVSTGVLVAYVYAELNDYYPLNLGLGGNCLYLHHDRSNWNLATIRRPIRRRGDVIDCQTMDTLRPGEIPLRVRPLPVPGLGTGDYSNAARWDWDEKGHQQTAGVRCDGQWCDVGGFTSSGGHPDFARSASHRERRTAEIKGWYDEQYLARCLSPTDCRPTALVGTIIPDSALDTATAYKPGIFVPVGRIALRVDLNSPDAPTASSDAGTYAAKKGISLTPDPKKLNQLFLCNSSGKDCFKGEPPPVCPAAAYDEVEHEQWWYRIISASGATKEGCFARRTSMATTGVHIVGAARWRWLLADETNWIRCVQGCCEVQK